MKNIKYSNEPELETIYGTEISEKEAFSEPSIWIQCDECGLYAKKDDVIVKTNKTTLKESYLCEECNKAATIC